jgi:hypothetical protein
MPEALAVLVVLVVSIAIWLGAWWQMRGTPQLSTPADLERLRHHESWLRQRLERAQREQWGADMVDGIAAELRLTSETLRRASVARSR